MDKLELFRYLKDVYFFELNRRRNVKVTIFLEMLPIVIIFFFFSFLFIFMSKYNFYFNFASIVNFVIVLFFIFAPMREYSNIPMTYMWHLKDDNGGIVKYTLEYLKLNKDNESVVYEDILNSTLENIEIAISDNHKGTNIIIEKYNKLKNFLPVFYLLISFDFGLLLLSYLYYIGKF